MRWRYLKRKPGSVYRQLFISGTRIMASSLYGSMKAHNYTEAEAAEEFGVSPDVVNEVVRYCNAREQLILSEARRFEKL